MNKILALRTLSLQTLFKINKKHANVWIESVSLSSGNKQYKENQIGVKG